MKNNVEKRKSEHLQYAGKSQFLLTGNCSGLLDVGLTYEPCLGVFPDENYRLPQLIGGKKLLHPVWISSMTGGSSESGKINKTLAKVVADFGLGMGLGSCRAILQKPSTIKDFQLRAILKSAPFWANLGICQIDEMLKKPKDWNIFQSILEDLEVDGLVVHINPTQEFLQPEGSILSRPVIDILKEFLQFSKKWPVLVKEVGQGMGPKSLKALSQLDLQGIELAALGGTNFSSLELLRAKQGKKSQITNDPLISLTKLGHSAKEMVDFWITLKKTSPSWHVIISGGRGHDVLADVALFKKIEKSQPCSIGLGYSILEQAYRGEKMAREWLGHYLKAFYYVHSFTNLIEP